MFEVTASQCGESGLLLCVVVSLIAQKGNLALVGARRQPLAPTHAAAELAAAAAALHAARVGLRRAP